jgi:hypothetical protein
MCQCNDIADINHMGEPELQPWLGAFIDLIDGTELPWEAQYQCRDCQQLWEMFTISGHANIPYTRKGC